MTFVDAFNSTNVPVPPPLPGAAVVDAAEGDMRRLMAEIDCVLSGRPLSDPRLGPRVSLHGAAGEDHFDWVAVDGASSPISAEEASGWLDRAKKERRGQRIRAAAAWGVALGVVGLIVGIAALPVIGLAPAADGLASIARSVGW